MKLERTLVILDGLDEAVGINNAIVEEAKGGNHRLLITSRPYGLQPERSPTERSKAPDLEVMHKGVSMSQVEAFVRSWKPDGPAAEVQAKTSIALHSD